eukprot:CAMPEP_0170541754 /NCGR_PEP_ID=MMETSP0211-20121228/1403_1 /TAXON_ID=311385 /ORGANISM="Pseudokeronopsis sp., Strain OXSARD2" /LENGTH=158 /DNA_ID=CAMNT_0010844607 /DNA_START=436 /DNA_END=909 /DNA_ORIENTATION=-
MIIPSYIEMEKLVNCVFKQQNRINWDKNLLNQEVTHLKHKHCTLVHQTNKAVLNFHNRDFYDKMVSFCHDGSFYYYFSSIPNGDQLKPPVEKCERAWTYFGCSKVERLKEGKNRGKLRVITLMQSDMKIRITPKIVAMFLPSGISDWTKKMQRYLNEY